MSDPGELDYQARFAAEALDLVRREVRRWPLLERFPSLRRLTLVGMRVLVVGAAGGRDCSFFVEAGAREVHGIDVGADVGGGFRHPRVRYTRCSAEELPFPAGAFDLVYSVATMEHVPDVERAFSEMVRVARPGGLVYCLAAPLWNAREGHHKFGMFPGMPWIHLRLSRDELLAYCREHAIRGEGGWDVEVDVDFVHSRYFNRVPAARYVGACRSLPVRRVIHNALWRDPPESLPPEVYAELEGRYPRDELLAQSHLFVAVK
jgi:SAM-dependent methyltransferase